MNNTNFNDTYFDFTFFFYIYDSLELNNLDALFIT